MSLQTTSIKNDLCTAYATSCAYTALATTAPGASAGTEVSGGSPAYARKASNWGSPASGVVGGSPSAFDVPASTTVVGINLMTASTGGTYKDGAAVTSQAFSSQGTYTVTLTYTQS